MERHAAEGIKADRDAHVRAALKSKMPWPEVMEVFGLSLEEIMSLTENQAGMSAASKVDDLVDAKPDPRKGVIHRGR